ncbi:trans-AT polyketide synthase/acyltransferase/oxidoreductase domain-containing protein [Stackebrandtia endophytica]|uniref:[acyl-carrier-protein] S-malonyltransferase n=1 Tax=Stackebrandtia endophytica TaxID=1496996 RepID=A0A543ARW0_9ACTN|nr:ACP S-malonyltransferase [Stackebrandtia endophytica]TQL75319.1 trans-AT polyketide synthase/acyltransferase/oxidoreductase domain-containing protein [Stackebrandtia endophytica]
MTTAWLFPGQGSQHIGMGRSLAERFPELWETADRILGYSVRDQCLTGAAPGLTDTRHVQPALFVVNALTHLAYRADHPEPQWIAGHSLGEYNALLAAGCFDFATGVRLVKHRGEIMSQDSPGGGMLAVIGASASAVAESLAAPDLAGLDIANRNSATQLVLSGPVALLERAAATVTHRKRGRAIPLRVSAPFHSRYMAGAAERFARFLETVDFADPRIPVVANVTGRPYPPGAVADLLARQLAAPVRWWESMSHLLGLGVTEAVELGPGTVLTGLWRQAADEPYRHESGTGERVDPPSATEADEPLPVPTVAADRPGPPRHLVPEPPAATSATPIRSAPEAADLGSAAFRWDYGLRYAYLAGSMFQGIASTELVARMSRAGLLGFFGAGGLSLPEVDAAIARLRTELGDGGRFGMNLLATPDDPQAERALVRRYLEQDIQYIEASGYTGVTAGVIHLRFGGARRQPDGSPTARHLIAKVSRPEVAEAFTAPPPDRLLRQLVDEKALSATEAEIAATMPVAGDLCVEADSGGHTDGGNPYVLLPALIRLRDRCMSQHRYPVGIRVGAAGGLGSPEAVAAAFLLGADFVLTGSVNQATPQADTSDAVKDMLAALDVQDTEYAPAGDMFELGARVQVVRKGTLFAARANKLYQLYRQHDGLDDIDEATRALLEKRYFGRTIADVWDETAAHLRGRRDADLDRADRDPKYRMALVFRWYLARTNRWARDGVTDQKVNFQIHCGPALGDFNRVVADTPMTDWRRRDVDAVAELLMTGAARILDRGRMDHRS